jgi:hypothetical protein
MSIYTEDAENKKFWLTLERGQYVLATSRSSNKMHIIQLTHSRDEDFADDKEKREKFPSQKLWSGRPFCTLRTIYYWTPWTEPGHESDRCRICFQRWRAEKEPPVQGWTMNQPQVDAKIWPLPFGWKEVPVGKHPHDVPPGGDITQVVDKEGDIVGVLRTELRRWQRGHCVVRLVEYHEDDGQGCQFGALYHDSARPHKEKWQTKSSQSRCIESIWKMMAIGGRP